MRNLLAAALVFAGCARPPCYLHGTGLACDVLSFGAPPPPVVAQATNPSRRALDARDRTGELADQLRRAEDEAAWLYYERLREEQDRAVLEALPEDRTWEPGR